MAPNDALPGFLEGFRLIHNEVRKLAEDPSHDLPYQRGAYLTPIDVATMRITFDVDANTGFWGPPDPTMMRALGETLRSFDDLRRDCDSDKKTLVECDRPTIQDAYTSSIDNITYLNGHVCYGLLHNHNLEPSDDDRFQNL